MSARVASRREVNELLQMLLESSLEHLKEPSAFTAVPRMEIAVLRSFRKAISIAFLDGDDRMRAMTAVYWSEMAEEVRNMGKEFRREQDGKDKV